MANLGPEVALSNNRASGPAAFEQWPPTLVTDGSEFVLSWSQFYDQKSPSFELRLDSLGQPLEPFARRLDDPRWYASTGYGDYLAMWRDDTYVWVQRVDAAGQAAGPPNPVFDHGRYYGIYGLVANRNCYLLVVSAGDNPSQYIAILLDRIGRVIQTRPLELRYYSRATPYEGGFVIAGCGGSSPCEARLLTISSSGTVTRLAAPGLPQTPLYAVRASDDRLMVTWWEKAGFAHFMILGFDGFVLKRPFTIPIPAEALPADLLWDGREFLLLLRDMGELIGKLRAIRLSGSGDKLNEPYRLSETASWSPVFAATETTGLLVWPDARFSSEPDVVGLRIRYFSELADSLDRATVMSRSPTAQSAVQIASSGSHVLAAWTNEPSHAISGWIDGKEFEVSAARREVDLPAVAGSPDAFLVAWNEFSSTGDGSLFVRRYALDGTPLDERPVEIFTDVPRSELRLEGDSWQESTVNLKPSLMYDGTSFVLFTNFDLSKGNAYAMRVARIDPQTGAVTTSSLPLSTRSFGFLRPIATAAGWYVPFVKRSCCIPFYPTLAISIATVGHDGMVRDSETPNLCSSEDCASFSAAHTQDTVTQLLATHSVSLWRSTPSGESLGKPVDISDRGNVVASDIVWNGSEYVAAWIINTGIVRVRRFAADGRPLDAEPFTIATDAEPIGPSIAVTPSGVVIAYSRHDDAYASVPRARMRTLERLTR